MQGRIRQRISAASGLSDYPRAPCKTGSIRMRIAVIGTSGVGKSTLAKRLAASTQAAYIELDAINWQADWKALATDDPAEFHRRVQAAVAGASWVCDGNYPGVRDVVLARATHVVWLDYARPVIMWRVIRRSFWRAVTKAELWPGTGNTEAFGAWLDKGHPIRWAWDTFTQRREQYARLLEAPVLATAQKYRVARPQDLEAVESALEQQHDGART